MQTILILSSAHAFHRLSLILQFDAEFSLKPIETGNVLMHCPGMSCFQKFKTILAMRLMLVTFAKIG